MRAVQHELASCNNLFPPRPPPSPPASPVARWCQVLDYSRQEGRSKPGCKVLAAQCGFRRSRGRLANVCVGQTGGWVIAEHRSFYFFPYLFLFFFLSCWRLFWWFFSLWLFFCDLKDVTVTVMCVNTSENRKFGIWKLRKTVTQVLHRWLWLNLGKQGDPQILR